VRFPYIPQLDESDCGVACLAMILKKYHSHVSSQRLREISGTDATGTTAFGLKLAFEHYGFTFTPISTNDGFWATAQPKLPLIAHLRINESYTHYVVVYRVSGHQLFIADPDKGKYKTSLTNFMKDWTGILLLAEPRPDYKPTQKNNDNTLVISELLKNQSRIITLIVITSFIVIVIGVIGSFYFEVLLDSVLPRKSQTLLSIISIGLLTLYFLKSLLDFGSNVLLNKMGQRMGLELMRGYIKHVLKLPLNFFETRKTGEIFTRFSDASKVIEAIASSILVIFVDCSVLVTISLILAFQNKILFLFTISLIPIYFSIMIFFYSSLDRVNRREMASGAKFNSAFIESLKGIETIKAYGEEHQAFKKLENHLNDVMKKTFTVSLVSVFLEACKQFIQLGSSVLLLWLGARYVMDNQISIGQLVTYNALLVFYMMSLENIIQLQTKLQTAKVATNRLNEILEVKSEQQVNTNAINMKSDQIRVDNLNFSYGLNAPILKNVTIRIGSNQKLALVGESGSGKSTLAKLIVKFYKPDSGSVYYDGQLSEKVDFKDVRENITYVSQDSFFFNGTIWENLVFGCKHEPSKHKVLEACKIADLTNFITQQPMGLQSILDEKGVNISGGQKQKISIARALIQKSHVIIFDESTSSLDVLSEKRVIDNLLKIPNRTILLITHNLPVAQKCENIFVMKNGCLIEQGTHDKLIQKSGVYETLWHAYR